MTTYRSDFGGTWTDRSDALEELQRRRDAGDIGAEDAERLRFWIDKGYAVLEGAVAPEVVDAFRDEVTRAFRDGDERLLVQTEGLGEYRPLAPGTNPAAARVVDIYAEYESARDVLFSKPIVDFLRTVFDDDPLLFQSLSFHTGSRQPMHQDTAYVVVESPLELVGVWIALEDIRVGSGELNYYVGSHRLPEYKFSGEHKHWNPERDGEEPHEEWKRLLHENAERLGMERQTFLAKKGDALVWAADLAHGGAPVTDETLTRRSLVGHFCPAGVKPNYFLYRDDRSTILPAAHGAKLSSSHFDLSERG
jgi:phytanoyl-CoA hydroxylase